MGTLESLYEQFRPWVEFFVVYIKEAHSRQGWPMPIDEERKVYLDDARTLDEREATAESCVIDLGISIPCLIDDMENSAARVFRAYPDRIFMIGRDGRVVYAGRRGPQGFKPAELKPHLKRVRDEARGETETETAAPDATG